MALRYLDGQLGPDDNEDDDDSDNDDSDDDDNSFFKRILFSKNASKGYYHKQSNLNYINHSSKYLLKS